MPVQQAVSDNTKCRCNAMLTPKIGRGNSSFRKPLLATLAILLGVVAIAYGSIWMYAVRSGPRVELGANSRMT
jgi:hypothetical protein